MIVDSQTRAKYPKWPFIAAFSLFFIELLFIGTLFKHGIDFTCLSNWPGVACRGASGALVSIYCICAALALFAFLFRAPFVTLFEHAGERLWPLGMNLAGVVLALVPLMFLVEGSGTAFLVPAMVFWTAGMAVILAGLCLYLAPLDRWVTFIKNERWRLLPLVVGSAFAPALATYIRPLWQLDAVASLTFSAVATTIQFFGYDLEIYPETRVIGAGQFYINIAPVCSGIEGIALVTIFVTFYLLLFRSELRFPVVLALYPIGIIISAGLNIVRIVLLCIIGLEGNPELAVGGFHSHAGWLMFTVIALGIVAAANTVGWLRKAESAEATMSVDVPPFFQDRTVAMILPFAVFMLSALSAQAFSENPSLVYPARVVLMAGVLWLFVAVYRKFEWALDLVAIGVGLGIGVMWSLIPVAEPDTPPAFSSLNGGLLVIWFVARGVGTTFLVPIIEELFFRGYLEQKLKFKTTLAWSIGAAVAVATLFALLHGRWAEAFVASLAFSYVMHRSGRVTDAIIAHGVANGLIFAVAVATQQIHII